MSESLATFVISEADSVSTLSVFGEVDMSNVQDLRFNLSRLALHKFMIRLDLTGVAYMDSHAIQAMFEFATIAQTRPNAAEVVVGPNSVVGDLVTLTQLSDVITVRGLGGCHS